jgi:DNA polymerase III subunit gamma/tau
MLYRKYRPQNFDSVIGQEHVVKTLQGALASGRLGHAYLFCGPRGTGKTTIARVLAKAINCEALKEKKVKTFDPCNECGSCLAINNNNSLDLIEIDAASNRGIDEIRALKESASVAAPGGGYKVFLIDEVHMLTKDAFNALLKVLEEPPSQVVFILATTESHKILPTVLSRVQRFDFKKPTHQQVSIKLSAIAEAEGFKVEPTALAALASTSDGAFRDAEVAMTKVLASANKKEKITAELVNGLLGLIPLDYYPKFLNCLVANDRPGAVSFISEIYNSGADLENFTKDFLEYLRKIMIHKINPATLASTGEESTGEQLQAIATFAQQIEGKHLIKMLNAFTDARTQIKTSPIPQLPLELAVMEIVS